MPDLLTEIKDRVLYLTLNRPDKLNAMSTEMMGGLVDNLLNWVTLLTSVVLMLVSRDRKCLHDLVAGTVVVRDPGRVLDRYWRVARAA